MEKIILKSIDYKDLKQDIKKYPNFKTMLKSETLEKVLPNVESINEIISYSDISIFEGNLYQNTIIKMQSFNKHTIMEELESCGEGYDDGFFGDEQYYDNSYFDAPDDSWEYSEEESGSVPNLGAVPKKYEPKKSEIEDEYEEYMKSLVQSKNDRAKKEEKMLEEVKAVVAVYEGSVWV
jgi:hypothetical protein